jgi:photosynthetic reaction center cytochrome c subunit
MTHRKTTAAALLLPALLLAGCELGVKQSTQTGYRGTGMAQIVDPDTVVKAAVIPPTPYELPAPGGPTARDSYQNVTVLGDLSAEEFNHLMASITEWVSPEQGCNYCHNPENLASDEVYAKNVARQMLKMTWAINSQWNSHVGKTGVTCWTCHKGQPLPAAKWANAAPQDPNSILGNRHGQNAPSETAGWASLPNNFFERYLNADPKDIRVIPASAYPWGGGKIGTKETEYNYGLMMRMSTALGVNCTYCHNSRSFSKWNASTPQRTTAWHGLRMAASINHDWITPIAGLFPAGQKGPAGDPWKVNCATCHGGQPKPLGGVSMLKDYPYLKAAPKAAAPLPLAGAPAPAVAVAPVATPAT